MHTKGKKKSGDVAGFVDIYRCLKQQKKKRVKDGALSGYTTVLHQPSFDSEVQKLVHTPATCKVICISFYPHSGHSMAGQVSDLFTFSLF